MKELEQKFIEIKKELNFKSSFKELDDIFFIKDSILERGFVSEQLSRQICSRIMSMFSSWVNYLNGLLVPPKYLPIQVEAKSFTSEEERKKIWKLIESFMRLMAKNTLIGLTKNKKDEGKFIDESVSLWNKNFKPELIVILKKVNEQWRKK